MGKPKQVKPVDIDTNYNWGSFGSADKSGVQLGAVPTATISSTQSGINQYLNELINPSYDNESFRARRELIDSANNQYARNLISNAMERGARGSGMQSALNTVALNRGNQYYQAMSDEDARVQNILSALSGIESNYFNQSNIMANNILQRQLTNAERQGLANATNVANYNAWKNNLLSGGAQMGGTALGELANYYGSKNTTGVYDVNGNYLGDVGGYGVYNPNE